MRNPLKTTIVQQSVTPLNKLRNQAGAGQGAQEVHVVENMATIDI